MTFRANRVAFDAAACGQLRGAPDSDTSRHISADDAGAR
jgi:hypothetical protein